MVTIYFSNNETCFFELNIHFFVILVGSLVVLQEAAATPQQRRMSAQPAGKHLVTHPYRK